METNDYFEYEERSSYEITAYELDNLAKQELEEQELDYLYQQERVRLNDAYNTVIKQTSYYDKDMLIELSYKISKTIAEKDKG